MPPKDNTIDNSSAESSATSHAVNVDPAQELKTIDSDSIKGSIKEAVQEVKDAEKAKPVDSRVTPLGYMPSKKMITVWAVCFILLLTGGVVGFLYFGGLTGSSTVSTVSSK